MIMNLPTQDIQALLQKEMSRKEFLRISGAAILGVVGVTSAVQNLHKLAGTQASTTSHKVSSGYGGSAYGK
jgi:hypothetical protein